jgi:NADPH:quinone reductase-like Zn-dependent oxidoreductase
VTRFCPGDEVFGFVGHGAFVEYVSALEAVLVVKPAGVSFEQAATVPLAAMTALQRLRDRGGLKAGGKVLITATHALDTRFRPGLTKSLSYAFSRVDVC